MPAYTASTCCTLSACLALLRCSHAEVFLGHKYCHQVPDGYAFICSRAFLMGVLFYQSTIGLLYTTRRVYTASVRCTLRACLSVLCCSVAQTFLCHKYCHQVTEVHAFICLRAFLSVVYCINPPSVCYIPPGMSTQQAYGALYVLAFLSSVALSLKLFSATSIVTK